MIIPSSTHQHKNGTLRQKFIPCPTRNEGGQEIEWVFGRRQSGSLLQGTW